MQVLEQMDQSMGRLSVGCWWQGAGVVVELWKVLALEMLCWEKVQRFEVVVKVQVVWVQVQEGQWVACPLWLQELCAS